jgi:ribonucleoside-diphosphate reductase alpha chain
MIEIDFSKDIWKLKYRNGEESEEDFYNRVISGIFKGLTSEEHKAYEALLGTNYKETYYNIFSSHKALPAGRGLYSLGTEKKNQTLSNCFVLAIENDSMDAIMEAVKRAAIVMKAGGGIGYSFSVLRPKNSIIKSTGSRSTGVLSFMRIFDTTCGTIEAGGNRRGAQIGVLGIWHPEVKDFIACKRAGDNMPPEHKPYKNFNLSVYVSDAFMQAVEDDADWDLIFPDTTFKAYNTEWDGNIKAWLEKGYPVEVYETLKARELWELIIRSNYDFAEPGILYEDSINRNNTLWMSEYILATNPCGEEPLIDGASCNLSSINLTQFVIEPFTNKASFDFDTFKETVKYMVVALDKILDQNHYPLDKQKLTVELKRLVGLGVTGLGDMFAMLKIKYSSKEALQLADKIVQTMFQEAYKVGIDLAKVFGPFKEWELFTAEDKKKFVEGPFLSKLTEQTKQDILKYGVRNSRYLTIAPTGTTSLIMNNVSGGVEPIFSVEYDRKVKRSSEETTTETIRTYSWALYNKLNKGTSEIPDYFETTDDLKVDDHLNMQAVFQNYICASISKTINVPVDYPFEEYIDIFIKAHKLGLKGCTTYRPNEIIGSVLSKTSDKLCSDNKRPVSIIPNCAPKRPKDLPCDIIQTSIKGEMWTVLISLLDDCPYEIFCGSTEDLYLPKSCKCGIVRKQGGGKYELEVVIRRSPVVYKDLASILMDDDQKAMTRLLSLSLRHGVLPRYIVEQLKKSNGNITAFSTAISRVLSKYIGTYNLKEGENKCPSCGEPTLIFSEGCIKCSSCAYSRCG